MAELRTEEEQVAAIKRWFKENGISLVAGVLLAGGGIFGWNAWQDHQEGKAEAASLRYQQLTAMTESQDAADERDDAALAQARNAADELIENHDGSLYAELGLLLDARLAVQQDDMDGARASLEQVLDDSPRHYVKSLARLRLARLDIAADSAEDALERLDDSIVEPLAAQRYNVRGDAYFALGQKDAALTAWQKAQTLADEQDRPLYGVALKLDDLGRDTPDTREATL
ncbi:MAG: tetratricopeptide repeat protein [Halomonas subglaciescola]|nr:tetratricopeptide repeat protein [Halomonas subglaciescola]